MVTSRSGLPGPEYARYAGLGFQFAGTLGILGLLGWWADRRLGTEPWLLILGVFLGFVGGTISMVRRVPASGARRTQPRSTQDETKTG